MHLKEVSGTILKMPEGHGFATYVVAHNVTVATNQNISSHIRKRTPPNSTVIELEYSSNFSRVKHDPGDVYIRINYSNTHNYYIRKSYFQVRKRELLKLGSGLSLLLSGKPVRPCGHSKTLSLTII